MAVSKTNIVWTCLTFALLALIVFQNSIIQKAYDKICEYKCKIVNLEDSRIKMFRYFVYDETKEACPSDCIKDSNAK